MDTQTGSLSRFYSQVSPGTGLTYIYEVVEPHGAYAIKIRIVYPTELIQAKNHIFPVNTKDFTDICTPVDEEDIPLIVLGGI